MTTRDEDVRISVHSGVGHLTLNRPDVLNAVSHDMVRTIHRQLDRWRTDSGVHVVVLDGEGEHGLSAGSDVVELFDDHGVSRSIALWRDEARLTAAIARFPKPVVAFMDGIVMGSGLGLAAHASHRIVEPDSVVAVPEIGIGLLPGSGTTYLLARAPGRVGMHLALTGDRMDASDALYCGFADYCIPRGERSNLLAAMGSTAVEVALERLDVASLPESELHGQRPWIDACYTSDRIEEVLQLLGASENTQARAAATRLLELSPLALKVVMRAVDDARSDPSVEEALRREFRVASRLVLGHDVHEGVRAMVIDRDRVPSWAPDTVEAVSTDEVDAYFSSLGPYELAPADGPPEV